MQEQLISFETAVLVKEKDKGEFWFTKMSNIFYNNEYEILELEWDLLDGFFSNKYNLSIDVEKNENAYGRPTQSLLQKWLREKHHLIIIVAYQYEHDSTPYSYWIYKEFQSLPINQWVNDLNTYEEALELGLQEALKLI